MVSVDTIRAYTYANININYLIQNGWKKWVSRKDGTSSYFIKDGYLLFWYFPQGILLIKFSIPKFYYGTNAKAFDLDNANLLIKLVNHRIRRLFPLIDIDSFENWTCSEIHPFVHFYVNNPEDKTSYLECLKKLHFPRMEKHKYATGIQARNGSRALNIYDKYNEIQFRAANKPLSISKEDLSVLNDIKNVIRFEYQIKKRLLRYHYKNTREVKDVLKKDFCQNMLIEVIKDSGLNNPFLYKKETIDNTKNEFGKVKAKNLIEFITDLNEKPENFINAKYPQKTISNYLRTLKEKNINPIFLPDEVTARIDFTNFEEPIKSNPQFSFLKIFLLIAPLKMCNVSRKNYYIKRVELVSVFTTEAYYHEDGGG